MKRFLPFIIFVAVIVLCIVLWIILPVRHKGFVMTLTFIVLVGVPLTVLSMYRKNTLETQLFVTMGFLLGALGGFCFGARIEEFIMRIIYGDPRVDEIRGLLGALLGAFIFSILGAITGAKVGRRRENNKIESHITKASKGTRE